MTAALRHRLPNRWALAAVAISIAVSAIALIANPGGNSADKGAGSGPDVVKSQPVVFSAEQDFHIY